MGLAFNLPPLLMRMSKRSSICWLCALGTCDRGKVRGGHGGSGRAPVRTWRVRFRSKRRHERTQKAAVAPGPRTLLWDTTALTPATCCVARFHGRLACFPKVYINSIQYVLFWGAVVVASFTQHNFEIYPCCIVYTLGIVNSFLLLRVFPCKKIPVWVVSSFWLLWI